jgi:lipoate-protein ligase A
MGLYAFSRLGNNRFSGIVATNTARQGLTTLSKYHPSCAWRHIGSVGSSGAANMAVDEALLMTFDPECSPPILRTYGWDPPALSLGRFQDAAGVLDLERCRLDAVDIVRRVSGGGTIYHADELTYSIICTQSQIPPAASVKDSFRVLTGFLIEFYRTLGLNACYAVDAEPDSIGLGGRTAFCFAGKETFDILIDGRKIGGNAQRRLKSVIFQHGSIPLINRAPHGLQYMKDRTPGHAEHTVSLCDCGIRADLPALEQLFVDSFRRHLEVSLCPGCLTEDEVLMARELELGKYSSEQWNLQGDTE